MKYIPIIILFNIFTFNSFCQEGKEIKVLDFLTNKHSTINIKEDSQKTLIFVESHSNRVNLKEVKDVTGIDSITVKGGRFLKIVFRIRGGAGEHLRLTKVFCISGGNLIESLSLSSSEISYLPSGGLDEKYVVDVDILYEKGKFIAYLNELYINRNVISLNKKKRLQLDSNKAIFYSQRVKDTAIKILGIKRQIKEYYAVFLSRNKYIYHENSWYQKGKNSYMRM